MKAKIVPFLVACLVLVSSKAPAIIYVPSLSENIVQNGEFASPNGTSIPSWDYSGFFWSSDEGVNGGSCVGVSGYFSQILPTQLGQTYLLQFSIAATTPAMTQDGPYGIIVIWGSRNRTTYELPQSSPDWITEELPVTADGSQTVLEFDKLYSPGAWPFLSAVSAVPIPEPGSAPLLLMMISLFGVWRMSSASARKPGKK